MAYASQKPIVFSVFFFSKNGLHASELILRYNRGDEQVIVDLKLNRDLIPNNHFMRYQLNNGSDAVRQFTKTDLNMCHYKVRRIPSNLSLSKQTNVLLGITRAQLEIILHPMQPYQRVMVSKG